MDFLLDIVSICSYAIYRRPSLLLLNLEFLINEKKTLTSGASMKEAH